MPRTPKPARSRRWLGVAAVVAGAALAVSACGSSGPPAGTQAGGGGTSGKALGNTVSFAEFPGSVPNWILPLTTPQYNGSPNTEEFSYLMWRPLYWQGDGASPAIDYGISVAKKPVYSGGDKTVTIDLNGYKWSDGQPVTARDVEFFLDLVKYDPSDWANYVKGNIPDNIASWTTAGPESLVLHLKQAVSPEWFTADQLSLVVPMPQHAWDKTSSGGKVGNYDETAAGAHKVMAYLISQSKSTADYTSNPLWKVVDGPWKLTKYTSTGTIDFTANTAYTGPVKPTFKNFDEIPFTSDSAEFNALLAGSVDYGYIPFSDLSQMSRVKGLGYHSSPWNLWTVNFIAVNYYNPTTGPLVSQLYLRQALESLVDQPAIIKNIYDGQGVQNFAAIPTAPKNPYSTITTNPNPYDPSRAVQVLKAHGWDVHPNGSTTCGRAGTGASDCGAGIKAGQVLRFTVVVNSGNSPMDLAMQEVKSEWSQAAGVDLNVSLQPFTTVISEAFASCTKQTASSCPWQMAVWGGGENLLPYPTGEQLFASTGASNASHYDSPRADSLIQATHTQGSSALAAYDRYITSQIPIIWLPNLSYQVSMISNKIKGADAQNPYIALTPEAWRS